MEETVSIALQKVSISKKSSEKENEWPGTDVLETIAVNVSGTTGAKDKYPTVIQLHGSLEHVKCTLCSHRDDMSSHHVSTFRKGNAPVCPNCSDMAETRVALGKRALSVGTLRPDVVLYNENHSDGNSLFFTLLHWNIGMSI